MNIILGCVWRRHLSLKNEFMELEDVQHKCGIAGFVHCRDDEKATRDVPNLISLMLVGLQHRGQESAGMVTSKGKVDDSGKFPFLLKYRNMGQINAIFTPEVLENLRGLLGIGHNRYATHGICSFINSQPFVVETTHGEFAVAHNGELTNADEVRKQLLKQGIGLSTSSDSELITQLLCHSPEMHGEDIDWASRIRRVMEVSPLSYSLLIMHRDTLIAVRDVYGNRPLCLGRVVDLSKTSVCNGSGEGDNIQNSNDKTLGWVVSSESCVFASLGAKFVREVLPGEIVQLTKTGMKSIGLVSNPDVKKLSFCIFEYIYFARPDSFFEGQQVYSVRERCGRQLAIEAPADVDIVSTVPDSATPAAYGYAKEMGLPYVEVLTKNRYVGRTFIQPTPHLRKLAVLKKFGVLDANFKGKRIVLLDDSIVRGNTMAPIVNLLRSSGATEVHVRVASPPIKNPCYMGINIPTRDELIANHKTPEKLAEYLGADSLQYLSVEGLHSAVQAGIADGVRTGHCDACLTGNYPVSIDF